MAKNKVLALTEEDKERYRDKIKVFVAEPSHGLVDYRAHDNRLDLYMNLARLEAESNYKFFTGNVGRLFTSYARELIAERAVEGGMDYILWIDDDMILPMDTFERLVRHDVDIVSPLTFMRVPPYEPVMWNEKVEQKENGPSVSFEQIKEYPKDILFPVGQLGFGVVLMKTDVLKKTPKPWFFNNTSVGEDIWFCFKAKQAGFKCFVDTTFCVGHLGSSPIITEQEFLQYKAEKKITLNNRIDFTVKGNNG